MMTADTTPGPAPTVVRPYGDFYAPVSCGRGYLQCSRTELRYFGSSLEGMPDYRIPIADLASIELWIPVNMHRAEKSSLSIAAGETENNPLVIDPVGILQWQAVLDLLGTVVLTSNGSPNNGIPLRHINGDLEAWNWEEGQVETDDASEIVKIHTFTGKGRQTDPRQQISHRSLRCVGARMRRNTNPTMMLVTDEQPIELSGYESFVLLSHINSLVSMGIRK